MAVVRKDQGLIRKFVFVRNQGKLYISCYCLQARVVYIIISVIGCALGGIARYFGTALVNRLARERFPLGTLVVNAIGSFLWGVLLGTGMAPDGTTAFLLLGFCGGLTTFSTFSLETFSLVSKRAWYKAWCNMIVSVVLCLVCVFIGYLIGECAIK